MDKKRSRMEIISDMLAIIQRKSEGIKPTHLMYKANLSHKQMKLYLDELIEKNLVDEIKEKKGKKLIITKKEASFYLSMIGY